MSDFPRMPGRLVRRAACYLWSVPPTPSSHWPSVGVVSPAILFGDRAGSSARILARLRLFPGECERNAVHDLQTMSAISPPSYRARLRQGRGLRGLGRPWRAGPRSAMRLPALSDFSLCGVAILGQSIAGPDRLEQQESDRPERERRPSATAIRMRNGLQRETDQSFGDLEP